MKNKNLGYLIIFSAIVVLIAELIGFKFIQFGRFTIIICINYYYDISFKTIKKRDIRENI